MNDKDFVISNKGVLKEYHGNDTIVIIPEKVKEIDWRVLENLDFVEEIILPDSIEAIDEENFKECKNLKFNEKNKVKYLGNKNNPYLVAVTSENDIKECNIEQGCKIIMGDCFEYREELTKVFIPKSVKTIGFMAFYCCNKLSELTLSEGLEKIDSCAFDSCNIKKVILPNTVKDVEKDAFSSVSIKEVILSDNITHIGQGAFTQNDIKFIEHEGGYYLGSKNNPTLCFVKLKDQNVKNFVIDKNCKIIYSDAFLKNKNIESVIIPDGLIQIGCNAFKECQNLKNIVIPNSITLIDECAFASCEKLKEIVLPNSVLTIESSAFMGCSSLEKIVLHNASVGDNAFEGCTSLKTIEIGPNCILYGDYIFSSCEEIQEVKIAKSLKDICDEQLFEESENVKIYYI